MTGRPDDPDMLTTRSNLGIRLWVAGWLGEAIPLYEQTPDDCERVLGADPPHTLINRNYLELARSRENPTPGIFSRRRRSR